MGSISHDDSDEEKEDKEKPLTAEQIRMQNVLTNKGQKIITTLLKSLDSNVNKD